MVHRNGESCYLAELYRFQGQLLLTQPNRGNRSRAARFWMASPPELRKEAQEDRQPRGWGYGPV